MFPSSSYVWNRAEAQHQPDVSISPTGEAALVLPDGDIDLYAQASEFFGQLGTNNTFTGDVNSFQNVYVQRIHVLSDENGKQDLRPLPDEEGTALVRRITPYRYDVQGKPAAGLLAQEVPIEYSNHGPDLMGVDYNSLMAELWASVRDAHTRLDALEAVTPVPDGSKAASSS
jgi:hypothetical protein